MDHIEETGGPDRGDWWTRKRGLVDQIEGLVDQIEGTSGPDRGYW